MKLKLINGILLLLGVSTTVSSFEVNTHQAITRCAISSPVKSAVINGIAGGYNDCDRMNSAVNLHKFVENSLLSNENYSEIYFEGYGKKYFDYAHSDDNFKDWQISFLKNNYEALIEAGVVLEDSNFPDADNVGDGRYNNHFYASQFISKKECPISINMLSKHALCAGYGKRTDNIEWALKDSIRLGTDTINGTDVVRKNDYNIHHAFEYYRKSFIGSENLRKVAQAKLFVSLGFMIHLIQDLHSPAHVRDGSHPAGDYLEIYGRYNGGFNLRGGNLNPNNNSKITEAVKNINMKQVMLTNNKYISYQDFFKKEAKWVSENFMSEAHGYDLSEKGWIPFRGGVNNETGEGLELDEDQFGEKKSTIFDKYNPHLAKDEVTEEVIPNASTHANATHVNSGKWYYLKNKNTTITNKVVALRYKGYFEYLDEDANVYTKYQKHESMAMVTNGSDIKSYDNYNKKALEDTAINVMPRAVVSSEAFINYFFRGRMKASLDYDPMLDEEFIKITNTSDSQWVSSPDLCTFNKGMRVDIYYIDKNGESKAISTNRTLIKDVKIGESTVIPMANVISSIGDMGDEKKIIVLLDGQLGKKADKNDYGIEKNGARGLVVAYASSRVANADISFSFDKSGSMGSDINNAKISAKDVLDDVIGVDNNSTYIEVEAFNSSVSVLMPYENNVTKAKARIDTLYSGGGTALYDAIKKAGNNAVAHKASSGIAKSIVILYTDGLERNSYGTKQQAIDAISLQKAGSIDEVFLIHVGSGGGASELKSIADQANRKYLKVDNATALKDAITKILRGQ